MLWLLFSAAQAEGIDATLRKDTVIHIDIVDTSTRYIYWTGAGLLYVESPDGTTWGELKDGQGVVAYTTGTWVASPLEDEPPGWDISVSPSSSVSVEYTGLVYSKAWLLSSDTAFDVQLFAPVPTGASLDPGDSDVRIVSATAEGLQGEAIQLVASPEGDVLLPGLSVHEDDATAGARLPLYLDDPSLYTAGITGTDVTANPLAYSDDCEVAAPGTHKLYASADGSIYGQLALSCDVNRDGDYDLSGETDLTVLTQMAPGTTEIGWDGWDAVGAEALPGGSYNCALIAIVSPVHLQVFGADVADPGIRLFSSALAGTELGAQQQFWNDALVDEAVDTSQGEPGLVHSGLGGIPSTLASATLCTDDTRGACSSHGWGAAGTYSRGSEAWVDTWSADSVIEMALFTVEVLDADDTDGDSLSTPDERCLLGTDPDKADTDGDGLSDGDEVVDHDNPTDTDDDDLIDALDEDDDNDGIKTLTEVTDAEAYGSDVDDDGLLNWHDLDSDDDGIPDEDEPGDEDDDGVPDYLDPSEEATPSLSFDRLTWPGDDTARGILSGGALLCGTVAPSGGGGLVVLALLVAGWRRQKVS